MLLVVLRLLCIIMANSFGLQNSEISFSHALYLPLYEQLTSIEIFTASSQEVVQL